MTFFWLALLALSGFSALLSAAETSLTAASRVRLHQLHGQGQQRAGTVLFLQTHMSQVIATILLTNTFVLTLLTALATNIFTRLWGEAGVFYAALLLSAFITIYLEVMPKVFVFSRAESTAMALAPVIKSLRTFLNPLTHFINAIAQGSLELFGVRHHKKTDMISSIDELKGAIELYKPHNRDEEERRMLKNILELAEITVSDVMIHRHHMFSLDRNMPIQRLVAKALASPFTRIPLWEENSEKIVGLLHIKELSRALQKQAPEKMNLHKIQTDPWFIPDTTTLLAQLHAFKERKAHFAFVVDEYGALAGLITLEDILEEIVGDIQDEHDLPIAGITPLDQTRFLIEGTVPLRDLNRTYNWHLDDSNVTTLAGFIMEIAGYIPKEKQTFTIGHLEFKVLRRWRNQIKVVEVKVHSPKTNNQGTKNEKKNTHEYD